MKIEHIALYVNDLEASRNFFVKYFGATISSRNILAQHPMTGTAIRKRTSARIFFPLMMVPVLSL